MMIFNIRGTSLDWYLHPSELFQITPHLVFYECFTAFVATTPQSPAPIILSHPGSRNWAPVLPHPMAMQLKLLDFIFLFSGQLHGSVASGQWIIHLPDSQVQQGTQKRQTPCLIHLEKVCLDDRITLGIFQLSKLEMTLGTWPGQSTVLKSFLCCRIVRVLTMKLKGLLLVRSRRIKLHRGTAISVWTRSL